jgi:hypothetical protein
MIKPLKRVNGTGRYQLSGDTLNALIDAANSWARTKIHVEQSESAASSVKHGAEGSILHIVVPPAAESSGGITYRELTASITVAGIVPTTTEISNALASAYTSPDPDLVPVDGDFVILTVSGTPKFVARVTTHAITASGVFVRSFVVNSVTYYATLSQCGLY